VSLWDDGETTEDEILDRWFDAGVAVLCVMLMLVAVHAAGGH